MGAGVDKPAPIAGTPPSSGYGKVIHKVSAKSRGEAHHMGFTDHRRFLWAGGLDNSHISIYDVGTDPAPPKLVQTISNMATKTGYDGPHTLSGMPAQRLVHSLSPTKDRDDVTGTA